MDRDRAGMLARSLAGHDAGQVFVITEADGAYVYLSDGRTRTADRPKKKKKKHVQPICTQRAGALDDASVRKILRNYLNQEKGKQEE